MDVASSPCIGVARPHGRKLTEVRALFMDIDIVNKKSGICCCVRVGSCIWVGLCFGDFTAEYAEEGFGRSPHTNRTCDSRIFDSLACLVAFATDDIAILLLKNRIFDSLACLEAFATDDIGFPFLLRSSIFDDLLLFEAFVTDEIAICFFISGAASLTGSHWWKLRHGRYRDPASYQEPPR